MKTKCGYCGIEIEKKTWQVKKYPNNFCSNECRYKHHSINISKEKNMNWKGGIGCGSITKASHSVKIVEFCEHCGKNKDEVKRMYVHHIDDNRMNNIKENLKVLCPHCHAKEHNRIKNIKWMQKKNLNQ